MPTLPPAPTLVLAPTLALALAPTLALAPAPTLALAPAPTLALAPAPIPTHDLGLREGSFFSEIDNRSAVLATVKRLRACGGSLWLPS